MIKSIAFENFLPFRKRVELPLADQGFVLVRGRNEISAAADANGVGKTSIMHAICYGLFGEDLKGRKADAVACRFTSEQCVVHVVLEDAKGEWTITRTRRPASLTVTGIDGVLENDDAAEIQRKIESRLGIGVRTFRNAVIFGQGTFDRFSQADQAEQMRMLDEIQGIDFRDDLARAKDWRDGLTTKLEEQNRFLDTLQTGQLEKRIDELISARNFFEQNKATQRANLEHQQTRMMESLNTLEAEEDQMVEVHAMLTALKKADAIYLEAVAEERKIRESARIAGLDALSAQQEEDVLVADLNELVDGGACPSCRRPTKTKAEQARIRKLFEPELTKLSTAKYAAVGKAQNWETRERNATKVTETALADLEALVPEGEEPRTFRGRLEAAASPQQAAVRATKVSALTIDLKGVAGQVEALAGSQWEGAPSLSAAQVELVAIRDAMRKTQIRVEKIEAMLAIAEYAVEAFGDRGLRSMMVDGIADYVNDRVREHLDVLAAGEATMVMSATTDLKKGGSKERISFKPEWSWGGNAKDDGSGGQDRRMDLAVFASVQDLAESRSARPFPLKAWDEPGDALDARGQELFVQWVAQQARTRGTGLLITHSIGIADAVTPDATWTVVLDDDGAHVEVS